MNHINVYACKCSNAQFQFVLDKHNVKNPRDYFLFLVSGRGLACEQQKTSNLIGF